MILGGTFDVDIKQLRVKDINSELEKETTWSNLELSQSLNKEKTSLEKFLDDFLFTESSINDSIDLLIMAEDEGDTETLNEISSESGKIRNLTSGLAIIKKKNDFYIGVADSRRDGTVKGK